MSVHPLWLRPKYATADHLFLTKAEGALSACAGWRLSGYHSLGRGRRCKRCEKLATK